MTTSPKSKLLLVAVIVLLLTNVGMLVYFLNSDHKKPPQQHNPREGMLTGFLKKEIGFDDEQIRKYDTLSKQHREKMKAYFDETKKSKQQIYRDLGIRGFEDSATRAELFQAVAAQGEEAEKRMLSHLENVRMLCNPDQLPKFDSLFYKIWDKKSNDKKKDSTNKK